MLITTQRDRVLALVVHRDRIRVSLRIYGPQRTISRYRTVRCSFRRKTVVLGSHGCRKAGMALRHQASVPSVKFLYRRDYRSVRIKSSALVGCSMRACS